MADCEKWKSFSGREVTESERNVQVHQVEYTLDVEEIFMLVNQKLTLRDRQDLLQSSRDRTEKRHFKKHFAETVIDEVVCGRKLQNQS